MEVTYLLVFVGLLVLGGGGPRVRYRHLRGLRLSTLWEVRRRLSPWQNERATFVWGRFRVPLSLANQHYLIGGGSGSGKTLILRLLMQSVFPEIGRGKGHRALVYDGKGDLLSIVLGLRQSYQTVFTFDPFLEEGVRWDIAGDVIDEASANQIARLLFPKQAGEHQPFFSEGMQTLAGLVILMLHLSLPGQWRFSHLIFILSSPDRLISFLEGSQRGQDLLSLYLDSGETWGNLMASFANRLNDYSVVASLWDHASHAVSLREWNESESIVIIRKRLECEGAMDAINRVLLGLAKRCLLSKLETPERRTWIIMDELASLGGKTSAQELHLLLEQGRSRQVCCALAFQNIASLRDEFGQYGADRLIALCSTKALLRAEDGANAEWAAQFFGKHEAQVETTSTSRDPSRPGTSTTKSVQNQERWTVLPSEFLAIPRADPSYGLTGYFAIPVGDPPLAFRDTLPRKWLFNGVTLAPNSDWEAKERGPDQQSPTVTTAEIEALLGLSPAPLSPVSSGAGTIPSVASGGSPAPSAALPSATQNTGGNPSPVMPPTSPVPSLTTTVGATSPAPTLTMTTQTTPAVPVSPRGPFVPPPGSLPVAPAALPSGLPPPPVSVPVSLSPMVPPPDPSAAQIWDLGAQTTEPVSIWNVGRAQS